MPEAIHSTLNLPQDLKRKALKKAHADGRTLSFVVARFLSAWVEGKIELPEVQPESKSKIKDKPIE